MTSKTKLSVTKRTKTRMRRKARILRIGSKTKMVTKEAFVETGLTRKMSDKKY
jgi:hypothetical protein